jgi:hypothetical protein
MGVSGVVGWDACEEVVLVLAREVVDSEGVEMVWRGEVRILKVRARCCQAFWLLWRTGEREVMREAFWAWSWEGILG